MVNIGDTAPEIELPSSSGNTVKLPGSKPFVLFFHPKDDTPGCTTEAKGFSSVKDQFSSLGIEIYGLSPDPVKKHDKFITKHDLTVELLSDQELSALQAYGVWVEKRMYGRTYMGVERSTFLVSEDGIVLELWRKVRVKGHVEAVLEAAQNQFG